MAGEKNAAPPPAALVTDERLVMSRSLGFMWGFGAVLLALTLVLPRSPGANESVLLAVVAVAAVAAVVMLAVPGLDVRAFEAITALGTVLIGVLVFFGGRYGNEYALFYIWLNVHAFYFLSWRRALLQLLLMGGTYPVALALSRYLSGAGRPGDYAMGMGTLLVSALFVGLLKDRVTRLLSRLSDAAQRDALTGLLNRRGFDDALSLELERVHRGGRPLSLLIVDLDYFKQVNDRFGHQIGDRALVRVTEALRASVRRIDTAHRIGGDEFAVLMPDTDERGALVTAERLRTKVASSAGEKASRLTVSVGVASFPTHAQDAHALVRAADGALYVAKSLGRDRAVVYSAEVTRILSGERDSHEDDGSVQVATMLTLAEALDIRDSRTANHSRTVGRHAELTASRLGLPADQVRLVGLAGILHDIGKIGVPDSILLKPGPLDTDEWEQMKQHPEIGSRLLGAAVFEEIHGWVLAHHERPDGRGYPNGLLDEEIPLEAKILAVADAYQAMTEDRVYRPAIGHEAARAELQHGAGEQFDARVVEAFIEVATELIPTG